MEKSQMKILGIVLLVVCVACIFIAIERYQANANNVRAMNQMRQNSPFGQMTGGMEMKPATPAATKYAALGALISGIAGAALLVMHSKQTGPAEPTG